MKINSKIAAWCLPALLLLKQISREVIRNLDLRFAFASCTGEHTFDSFLSSLSCSHDNSYAKSFFHFDIIEISKIAYEHLRQAEILLHLTCHFWQTSFLPTFANNAPSFIVVKRVDKLLRNRQSLLPFINLTPCDRKVVPNYLSIAPRLLKWAEISDGQLT